MNILLAYFRLHSVRTAALIYFLISGVLTQIPLFNYLGYEFSAVMTIPAALISGLLTIGFLRIHVRQAISRRKFLLVVAHYFIVNGILLLIPLAVMSANALAVKNCSFVSGLEYYALLPCCSMIFGVSLALPLTILFRRARAIFVVLILAILAQIVLITYTEPQLFAYNFVLGYFPGITYDETLNNLAPLVLSPRIYAHRIVVVHHSVLPFRQNVPGPITNGTKISSHSGSGKETGCSTAEPLSVVLYSSMATSIRARLGFNLLLPTSNRN